MMRQRYLHISTNVGFGNILIEGVEDNFILLEADILYSMLISFLCMESNEDKFNLLSENYF